MRAALFQPLRPGYSAIRRPQSEIKAAIFDHPEFSAYHESVAKLFAKWRKANAPRLRAIRPGDAPKALVEALSEDLLQTFQAARLIDPYDVYQHLMDYWADGMQDDVYLLAADGWLAVVDGKPNTDLVPERLVAARFFAAEQAAVEALEAERDAATRQVEELDEEHGGEDGLLAEAKTDKGKLTKAGVAARLREVGPMEGEWDAGDEGDGGDACGARRGRGGRRRTASVAPVAFVPLVPFSSADTEPALLRQYLELLEREADASRKVREAGRKLDAAVAAKYGELTVEEVKALVVDDKWLAALDAAVRGELDRVSQTLTGRIRQLAERYAEPLPKLEAAADALAAKVAGHLKRMGFKP